MSKGVAFLIGIIVIIILATVNFLLVWVKGTTDAFPTAALLTATVTLVSGYVGLQVANNGVKGAFFNKDLYEKENNNDNAGKDRSSS